MSPKVKPLTHLGRVQQGNWVGLNYNFWKPQGTERDDRAERDGSRPSRRGEGSRGDRGGTMRGRPGSKARRSLRLSTEQHPARRAGPQAARVARASPRAERPGPGNREGPQRGQARAVGGRAGQRRQHAANPSGSTRWAVAAATALEGLRAWAPGGPGRTPRRTHRGRATAGEGASNEALTTATASFPSPTPQAAAVAAAAVAAGAAVAAAAAATPSPESAAVVAAALLPLPLPLPLRPKSRPALHRLLIGQARHGVAPAA